MLNISYLKQHLLTKLSTKAIRLLPQLEMFTDLDGKIVVSTEELREKNLMTPRLLPAALNECEQHGFISKHPDGTYYNNFHYVSSKKERGYNYINAYDFFNHDLFKRQYKRSLNFFYYILTSQLPGKFHTIAAEKLYQNVINEKELAVDYFQDFKDMAQHLCTWVSAGFLELKIGNDFFSNANGQDTDVFFRKIETALYKYCGKDSSGTRKARIRNKRDRHLLKIRVTESLISSDNKNVYDRRATLKDLQAIALTYGHDLDDYHIDYLTEVHMLKRELHDKFGSSGIQIYRKALVNYFSISGHNFDSDLLEKRFVKNIKKYYIMPEIKLNIVTYINTNLKETSNLDIHTKVSITENYVQFLSKHGFYDDAVLVHAEIETSSPGVTRLFSKYSNQWMDFMKLINSVYATEKLLGNDQSAVIRLAGEGKLHDEGRIKGDSNRRQEDKSPSERERVMFYDWLD